jgi:hypothetical protein
MAKTKKIISLILIAVLALSLLSGCTLFTQTTAEQRAQTVIYVNGEDISLGQFIDTFNNIYYDYYYYVYYGYYSMNDIAQMAFNTLVNSYMVLSDYKALADKEGLTYQHEYTSYKNAKYLSAYDMEYIFKSIKKSLYTSFDTALETIVKNMGYTLASAGNTTESNRKPKEYQKISSILDIKLAIADKENIDKYLSTTAGGLDKKYWNVVDGYVFDNVNDPALIKRVEELNARITLKEGQQAITAEQYIMLQKDASTNTALNIFNEYGQKLQEFLNTQIESAITARIINSAAARIFKLTVESNMPALLSDIQDYYNFNKQSTTEQYTINPSAYTSLVEALKNTSIIYTVPEEYKGAYIFVKNLLIPFSNEQIKHLEEKEKEYKDDKNEEGYLKYREEYAAQIVLENYLTNDKTTGVFTYDATTGKLEIKSGSILANALAGVKNASDFEQLMFKYNSDTAQFDAKYDYVVRVNAPSDYKAKWVSEFVDAAEQAYAKGKGGIGMAVSQYGVHVVYYVDEVTAVNPTFTTDRIFDTSTVEYQIYSLYYDAISGAYINDRVTELKKTVKIKTTRALQTFLDNNSLKIEK